MREFPVGCIRDLRSRDPVTWWVRPTFCILGMIAIIICLFA